MYQISQRIKDNAKKLGVTVKPSTNKNKKIDVFKNDKKVASVGAIGYKDYSVFLKEDGKEVAEERKRLYKIRHQKDRNKVGTPSYYADRLLWN
jgi:Mn-dependent DtxR family transcriptional regulator